MLTIILLSSLPKVFENFVVAMETCDSLPKFADLKVKNHKEGVRKRGAKTMIIWSHLVKKRRKKKENHQQIIDNSSLIMEGVAVTSLPTAECHKKLSQIVPVLFYLPTHTKKVTLMFGVFTVVYYLTYAKNEICSKIGNIIESFVGSYW